MPVKRTAMFLSLPPPQKQEPENEPVIRDLSLHLTLALVMSLILEI
jgi:hypothetical protein